MAERAESAVHRGRDAVPPEAPAALAALVLAERRGLRPPGEGWTARAPDGALLDVWRVAGLDAAGRARCVDALSALVAVRHPNLVPVLAVGERDGAVWVVSQADAGRPLRRLLAVATLTPEQAALVTLGVLDGLEALHGAGLGHGRLDERTVHVGPAGAIRLGAWGLGVDDQEGGERRERDREAAVRLLGRLGRSARRPPRGAGLHRALEACGERDGDQAALLARAREAAASLLDGGAAARAAHELAVLVGMLERDPPPLPRSAEPAPLAAAHPLRSPAAVWTPETHRARWLAAGLSALVLAALFVTVTARYVGSQRVAAVPHPKPAATSPPARPAPAAPPAPAGPRPVPALGPATAGPITGIEIQPLQGSCQPGAVCPVQVTVRLQPQPAAQEVRWSFHVFDRCTGATSVLPGASVTALAGWAYVYGTSWPALSASHPLALVAVTETPAAAASPAVLAGGSGC